jgi:hypothetical protein
MEVGPHEWNQYPGFGNKFPFAIQLDARVMQLAEAAIQGQAGPGVEVQEIVVSRVRRHHQAQRDPQQHEDRSGEGSGSAFQFAGLGLPHIQAIGKRRPRV